MADHKAQRTNQCFDVKSIQGYILRLFMLNIFVSDLDEASEYTVDQITDDAKLGWGMTKDRASVQRNLEKLQNLVNIIPVKMNKVKYKGLYWNGKHMHLGTSQEHIG